MYAHRSAPLVVGIMGILKSGATFTVVDPAYPAERQIIYLKVAQPRAVVSLAAAGALSPEVQGYIDKDLSLCCQINGLTMEATSLGDSDPSSPGVTVGPDNIGTLSFTSGSTGIPKAVRGRHISLTHFYPWMSQEFKMGGEDRFSMLSGIAHDPIQRDVFTPIFMGASIYIPQAEDIGNPGALAEWVQKNEVSVVHLTPAMGQLLTANAFAEMPSLKVALFVGDILTKRDVKRLQRLAANVVVVNMYGTTETQRAVSYLKIPNDNSINSMKEVLPSGQGMKDAQILVLNSLYQPAGVGELGEIFMRSPHMSAGYLGLPEATAKKFLTNPITRVESDRMYRSGDLGRYYPNGIVECVGRADDQVKIRGFRIELGEIDTHLGQHPHVRENRTLVLRNVKEEKEIISYFVPAVEDYSIQEIRLHLQSKLPKYSVPTVLCPIKKMPLTPNGKVDTKRLPYPDTSIIMAQHAKAGAADNTAQTPLQKTLLKIFADVLGHPVNLSDNFFDVGGHSILATRLTFELRNSLKQDLPLNLLYQYPTVVTLSEALQASMENSLNELDSARESADVIDVNKEVVLDAEIAANGRTHEVNEYTGIFLTGATGFLGAFLLKFLLDKYPNAVIRCLVRAATQEKGYERLEKNLQNHEAWTPSYAQRILPVVGDLSKRLFGLENDAFQSIADQTQMIIHNGAMVHWVYPYSKLKPMNVGGTVECLRLGTCGKSLAAVHFVSSTSVFDSPAYTNRLEPVSEDDDLSGGSGLSVGYGQSKWISEKLIKLAISRGVPATIFRPGYVTGESKLGVMNTDDYLVRLMKGCIQLGKAPSITNIINACPVDFVARAIVHITGKQESLGLSFHFDNPKRMHFLDYFAQLNIYGYDVEFVEYLTWRNQLMEATMATKDNALYPLLHFVLDDLPTASNSPELSSKRLYASLEDSDIKCPAIDEVAGIYLSYLVAIGYLDAPTRAGSEGVKPLPKLAVMAKGAHRTSANP
eukprot:m.205781 g.205781  ORF g.205781 m.205781 type:complete len:984 (-) comp15790_c0_seq1:3659-6610(-)